MVRKRLDNYLVERGLAATRSQANNYIKLGKIEVDGKTVTKSSFNIAENAVVKLTSPIKYVSRAALKLESVADKFHLDFRGKSVLDVGSSTGGFTDYALQHGASKVIAVDVGKNQMDSSLRRNPQVELHEQTDIRNVNKLSTKVDYCLIDVSFISIKPVLAHLLELIDGQCIVIGMVKPQFESDNNMLKNKGVIKNESMRRKILIDFESWSKSRYKVIDKADSKVAGPKGNIERFYLLKSI
jgi:23S rRNA (cytidine1920-2'-O)/16S rRNA (cytidine1409-2'-O)-methyltransferase